jgi:hypothetical protein
MLVGWERVNGLVVFVRFGDWGALAVCLLRRL